MRRILSLLLIAFFLCILVSCNQKEMQECECLKIHIIEKPEDIDNYIVLHGYEILESKGKTEEYTLDKQRVYQSWQIWSVQHLAPDDYIGKEISIYSYIIKNHPLDNKSPNKKTNLSMMVCGNEIIGGYSSPYYEEKDIIQMPIGEIYSFEGKNFENVKSMEFNTWRDEFLKKYE
ncbi:DUF4830 domain-containing protein [Acetivibrio straminisolvens]|nr:DUF4830 domain-containing protein [Acetivibrio straminisolvens]